MATLSERLNQALERTGMSKRAFITAMARQKAPGSSEPAVYRYLRGENEPSLAFLEIAAEVLGVRVEWLVLGRGEPTLVEEELTKEGLAGPDPWTARVRKAFGKHAALGSGGFAAAIDAAQRRAQHLAILGGMWETPDDLFLDAAADVGRYVTAALNASQYDPNEPTEERNPYRLKDFVTEALQAYNRLTPAPAESRWIRMHRAAKGDAET